MTQVSVTVASVYYQVQFVLAGVPTGVTPLSTIDGSIPSTLSYMFPTIPLGTGLLTGSILGNDRISINGTSGTYYTVTVTDSRSKNVLSQANYEILGDTFNIDTATPILTIPIPGVNPVPESATYPTLDIFSETPVGTVDGVNTVFVLRHVPLPNTLCLYSNGLRQKISIDYSLSGANITFLTPPAVGYSLIADYGSSTIT